MLYCNAKKCIGGPKFQIFCLFLFIYYYFFLFFVLQYKKMYWGPQISNISFNFFFYFLLFFRIFCTAILKNVLGGPNFKYLLLLLLFIFYYYYFFLNVLLVFFIFFYLLSCFSMFFLFFHIFGEVATPCEWGTFEWAPSPYKWQSFLQLRSSQRLTLASHCILIYIW